MRRLEEGRLAHTLLQRLPDVAPELRAAAAVRYLATRVPDPGGQARAAIIARVLGVIDDPALASLFGPRSRAEVPIAAFDETRDSRFLGRVDRLAVEDDCVVFADFKSGAPRQGAAPQRAFVAQMALYRDALRRIYPSRRLRGLLVFMNGPTVVELSTEALDAAFDA
jgi:ATP-dependent helicase/nuclease subunit A